MELEKLSTPKEPIPPQASHSTWTWLFPLAGLVALAATLWRPFFLTWLLSGTLLPFLVFTGVHHAEAISHRTGEPFGMLVRWPSLSRGVAHRLAPGAENAELARAVPPPSCSPRTGSWARLSPPAECSTESRSSRFRVRAQPWRCSLPPSIAAVSTLFGKTIRGPQG